MERIERIRTHKKYKECCDQISEIEQNRIFCKHNLQHFLDVARIAYILNLERQNHIDPELIYAAALLHDIGKQVQYLHGIPHEEAGIQIAREILNDTGFKRDEQQVILRAVQEHCKASGEHSVLGRLLYEADKLSRQCFSCQATEQCKWAEEMKSMSIRR